MDEALETSEFLEQIREEVVHATDEYYTCSVSRPGQGIPVFDAFILQQLLDGFNMLDSLESTDRSFVLSPKTSKEDEHLVCWRSVSESAANGQS